MVELDKKSLRMLQMIELELLLEVDRICKKHQIPYTVIGGTLLGSVRHQGFIPWDDDADLAMMRKDYIRFRNICRKELDSSKYYFQDAEVTDGYRWSYGKLRRKDTLFLREHQEHMPYEQGVFIDVFPVDHVPDAYIPRAVYNVMCFCIRKILWSKVGQYQERNLFKRKVYQWLSRVPEKDVIQCYLRMVNKQNRAESRYARIGLMPVPGRAFGYPKKWYMQGADYEFEGYTLKGIRDAHDFLRFIFGNYMELPPEKERKVHPVSRLELFENELYQEDLKKSSRIGREKHKKQESGSR